MLKLTFLTLTLSIFTFSYVMNRIDTQTKLESYVSSVDFKQFKAAPKKINQKTNKPNVEPILIKAIQNITNEKTKVIAKSSKSKIKNKQDEIVNIDTSDVENLNYIDERKLINVEIQAASSEQVEFIKLKKEINIEEEKVVKVKNTKTNNQNTIFEEAYLTINGTDPIKLKAFEKVNKIKEVKLVALLDNVNYPKERAKELIAKIEMKKVDDRISNAQAAPERSVKNKTNNNSMDLTFYDYSNEEETSAESQKSVVEQKLESLKKTAVGIQLMQPSKSNTDVKVNSSGVANTVQSNLPSKINDIDNLIAMAETIRPKAKSAKKKTNGSIGPKMNTQNNENKNSFLDNDEEVNGEYYQNPNTKSYSSYGTITAFNLTTRSKDKAVMNFDLIYSDEFNTNISSDVEGKVDFKYQINSKNASRRVTINARDFLPTSIDLVLDNGDSSIGIPLIERTYFNNLMSSQNLRGLGGVIMVELDNFTEDIELGVDSRYERKLYLNKNLRAVSREDSDFTYILFVGVEAGNHIISFKTYKNKITNKIIHVVDEEIYYDYNFYKEISNESVALFEENLLSNEYQLLNITKGEITPINYDSSLKMKSFNMFELKDNLLPHATRNYYQLNHLREKIFIGRANQKQIIVPSEAYTREVISHFDQRVATTDCVIQLNINKPIADISFNGLSNNRMMVPLLRVLDSDGEFYKSPSNETKRVFILGREQGIVNFQINYTDGTKDFLQSYCSESSYLVEQL